MSDTPPAQPPANVNPPEATPATPPPAEDYAGFQSLDALKQGYQALRTKMSAEGAPPAPAPAGPPPAGGITPPAPAPTEFNFDKYTEEVASTGKLGEQSYAELAARGLPREVVDAYVAGAQQQAQAAVQEIHAAAGGQAAYDAAVEWATHNMTPEAITAFNQALDQGGAAAEFAVKGLMSEFANQNPQPPQLVQTEPGGTTDADVYHTRAEMVADMKRPEYKDPNNPTFRQKVLAKLARSNFK